MVLILFSLEYSLTLAHRIFFKQDPGTRLFQAKPGKWFPMGIFVFFLNLLNQNTVSGSLLIQYFFQSAEKFIVGSY